MRRAALALAALALALGAATAPAQVGHDGHGMDDVAAAGVSMSASWSVTPCAGATTASATTR